jgi:hypothetical protein
VRISIKILKSCSKVSVIASIIVPKSFIKIFSENLINILKKNLVKEV